MRILTERIYNKVVGIWVISKDGKTVYFESNIKGVKDPERWQDKTREMELVFNNGFLEKYVENQNGGEVSHPSK